MKRLILLCGLALVVLVVALSLVKIYFPFGYHNPVLFNAGMQIFFKEIILIPMFILILAAKKRDSSGFTSFMLYTFIIIAVADAVIVVSMAGGILLFTVCWAVIGYNFTAETSGEMNPRAWLVFAAVLSIAAAVFLLLFDRPLRPDTLLWGVVLVYTLVMGYGLARAFTSYRTGNYEFTIAAASGASLFFICDCQVGYSAIVHSVTPDIWSNNVIYYSGLFFLALTPCLRADRK